jgi:hypothetical protein
MGRSRIVPNRRDEFPRQFFFGFVRRGTRAKCSEAMGPPLFSLALAEIRLRIDLCPGEVTRKPLNNNYAVKEVPIQKWFLIQTIIQRN